MILRRLCSISVVLLSTLLLLLTANTAFAQDSSGVTCIGHVSFDWGSANSVTVSGDYAYVTSGRNGFWIVDVSDSIRPVEIGGADTPGYACGVAVAGDYAFIADSSYGIRIFNISIPSSPIAVGFYDTPGTAYSVVVSENFAYVADGTFGLRILDVTNPASPQQTGFFDTPGTALYLTISGNIVYIADGVGGLRIIDITNPSNPIEIGFYTIPWIYICKIVVQGNFAYLADYAGSLRVVDISNPVNPVPRGYYLETGEGSSTGNVGYDGLNVFSVSLSNNHAFISSEYYTGSTRPPYRFFDNCFLRTIDISNPDSLRQVRFSVYGYVEDRQYTGVINDLDVVRGTIYAASRSSGLCLRDTVNATLFASGLDKSVVDVAVARGFAYIALGNSIRQYNLTDLANQQCRFVYRTRSKPLSIVASDSFLYIADGSVFRIFACDDPNNISEIGSCITPYAITKITIYNDYAYLSAYTSGISIIDISNPTSPRLVDSADSPGQAWGIAVSGNSAFVADGESGIAIFDVSHPDSLRLIRVLDTPGFASKITTESNFAYTADGDSGLCIHDIANPLQPVEVGRFDTPGIANDVKVSGSYAFIADGPAGIRILNLSDPARPQEVGYYNTLGNANAVSITDSIIFVADGNNFGVFDYSQILGVVNRASEVIPQHFSLKPNYPNPFNSSTEIRYTIAKASIVDLRVFDISGRAIAKLIDFHQNPGEYTFHFEGKSLATGTYFVRLNAGNFSQTQKMVLMK